jgi:diguanylate cyclase (GGDEF)-like protein/PAS domain S-box-containing protein
VSSSKGAARRMAPLHLASPSSAAEDLVARVPAVALLGDGPGPRRSTGAGYSGAPMSVLVIEDNRGDARLVREMIKDPLSNGATITHVETMADAEATLHDQAVDIILLDLGLPDVQGLDAVRRAHAAAPHTPVVVLTGLDDETLAGHALQEGAQDYLIKSEVEIRGLLRALRYALERKAMEEALFAEKERAEVTLNCIGDAVVCTDSAGVVTFFNEAAEQLTGWDASEAIGQRLGNVLHIRVVPHEQDPTAPNRSGMADLPVQVPPSGLLRHRHGNEVPVENSVAAIHDRDGEAAGAVIVFRDVTQARAMTLEMIHTSEHDFLTGLPNRMLLNDRITQAIGLAGRYERQIAVLFLDLDGFKHINDSLGHSTGDKLLQSVAEALVGCVRTSDTVSRQGGDEFVVLLIDMDGEENAIAMAERILVAVARPHSVGLNDLHVTASIGVSVYPLDGLDAETLIKSADTAMYQAKDQGRHTYRFFTPEMNVRAVERHTIEENLRRALEEEQFRLHYQPKVDLRTGAITGAEALIRWSLPDGTTLAPSQFIPVAEESGLILPIGNWVLREACRQTQAWVAAGLPMSSIAVNISAVEFGSARFLDGVFEILAETGLDPTMLELELTESVLMKRIGATSEVLQALRERGVRVAVDDFGTGYSSLSYLRRFPVDALKIDQSFVRQISASGDDATIVTAVISMARSLNLRVVAEGVEEAKELAFLQDLECDEAQGYLFSRAVPADDFATLLRSGLSVGATSSVD